MNSLDLVFPSSQCATVSKEGKKPNRHQCSSLDALIAYRPPFSQRDSAFALNTTFPDLQILFRTPTILSLFVKLIQKSI